MDKNANNEIPPPGRTNDSASFWAAADAKRLEIGYCGACSHAFFQWRPFCPLCSARDALRIDASGKGTIYAFSILRTTRIPFALAYVTLEEGPSILTNIIDSDMETLAIGQPVELVFSVAGDGSLVPMFRALDRMDERS